MRYLLLLMFLLIIWGCSSNVDNNKPNYVENQSTIANNEIKVYNGFNPTIEITEHIRNSSLDELVIENYEKWIREVSKPHSQRELLNGMIKSTNDGPGFDPSKWPGTLISVPKESALAKAYLLQNPIDFKNCNKIYYNRIIEKYYQDKNKRRNEEQRNNWNNYLNN